MRISVARSYILLLVCCVVLFVLLAFHELVQEPFAYAAGGPGAESPKWVAIAELAIYSCVPFILLASWLLIRRTLRPLHEIARQIDAWDPELGLGQIGGRADSPEALAVAVALTRASERLSRAFREIREFSLRASHEIKTPLTILRGQAESEARYAELRGDSGGVLRMEAQIEEVDRLARMVDSLGFLARADGGMLSLNLVPGRLDDLAREFHDDICALAEPSGLCVCMKVDRPVFACFDRRRIRQVFLSLAENAVKYNIPGGLIEFGADEVKGQASLWIENTGIPLVPGEEKKVFEPFFRGSQTREEVEGTGLGLSLARSVMDAHGGQISFESLPENKIRVALHFSSIPAPVEPPSRIVDHHNAGSGI